MVVEWLTFTVDPRERDQWVDADARTWTRFLARQPGFVRKELWVDRTRPDLVHALVWWQDEASWQAVPAEDIEGVDAAMGPWRREPLLTTYDVVREG